MKKLSRMAVVLAIAVVMCLTLVGCGSIKIDDIKGDWTLDTIDGKSLDEIGSGSGVDPGLLVVNWTIKDEKTLVSTNATTTEEMAIELKSNGFEVKQQGKDEVFFSVTYDKDKQTLTYKLNMAGTESTYVMKKGTAEIGPTDAGDAEVDDDEESADDGSDAEAEGDDESVDDGSEEGDDEGDFDETEGDEGDDEEVDDSEDYENNDINETE